MNILQVAGTPGQINAARDIRPIRQIDLTHMVDFSAFLKPNSQTTCGKRRVRLGTL